MFELPAELTAKPLALIGLTGLDLRCPVHGSIWDAFNNNRRSEGAAVQFKLLSLSHEFPTVKPKRSSYEWYIPKGILKRNWMNKYLNDIPSVVVVFYDLDWSDPLWNEKKMECASRVQSLRASLDGRSTKIAVVLIQRAIQPPPGAEDVVATERATALCGACDLTAKFLYILPHADHLLGYTSRLETAFYDLAQNFYHHEYRNIKSHRDQLTKNVHQYLFVRHQFKMAFLNELKQEQHLAQKHYMQAYHNLLETRMTDANAVEIKTIASFINYKLCKIMFSLNLPKDAISQFRLHTERFKLKTGPKELMFEHHAWMSSQFSTFAELFDEAIRQGLPAVQTQHPGYYFQLAANHAGLRQSACKELCQNVNSYPDPDPLAGEEKLEFYGQRPWRPGKLSAEPADTAREIIGIQALQYREKTSVNHSMIIIGLLGNAISQFKVYRCPRMRRLLVVQMAEEYFNAQDYGKVLTLLMHMLWDYHGERWPVLLTDILKNALRAAYLSTSIQDYLTLALEALGPSTTFSEESGKAIIYDNIMNILQKKPPNPEPDLPDDVKHLAMEKWALELSCPEPSIFKIDDNNMTSLVDLKARFLKPTYAVNTMITVEVIIRNSYCGIVEFTNVLITVSGPGYNVEIPVSDTQLSNLVFQPKETKKFYFNFKAPHQSVEIRISTVSLQMGDSAHCCIILRCSAMGRETNLFDRLYPEIQQLRGGEFEAIRPLVHAEIKQEESSLNIHAESNNPALLGEWLPIIISLSANEDVTAVSLHTTLVPDGGNEQSTELSLDMLNKQSKASIPVNNLNKGSSVKHTVYIRAHKVGDRNIVVKAEYARPEQVKGNKELTYTLAVKKPFEVTTQFYTTLFEPLTNGFVNEPFIIMPHVTCVSPWPINILSTSIELADSIERENNLDNEESILADVTLCDGEAGTDAYCLIPKIGGEQPISTGVYTIKWKRANDETALETSSSVTLAPLCVEDAVIGLEAKMPAHGWVRTPFCISYFIKNHSDYLVTLRLAMEGSDAFMFAGQKQVDVYILPRNVRKVDWVLRPLVAGFVALPTLSLTVPADEEHKIGKARLSEVVERSLPSHIYILPKSQSLAE
ncbi:PREDICTED: trafficking protein particle complex subunit 11 [Dinoponera quadriceps]|uniref:Trafficking protein particle complex subunit 11 n=1 Tax=Dinoponera quadriceps TaxID=609295 RepID=A0A6P3XAL0_DINQU|nr:PREDICTED: trafficking protein particle complex subunit 11 [Dinoponera quadriceps]XP_014475298.1 PREDICTED: trafficking protein particle complex subunit 11 [Dinoponera quadriceps]